MTLPGNMVAALQRLNGREMLINTDTADEFVANLSRFSATDRTAAIEHEITSRDSLCMAYGIDDRPEGDGRKPFVYQDGVAVIPVHGTLLNRFNSSWGFVTGYNFLRRQLNLALDDDDVENIVWDMNSPGGEASGCFELAREILASRRVKPSLCMVDSLMASGGLALGVAASATYAIPSARIGSCGVYRQHVSIEGALDQAGVQITFAVAGEHKIDGNPYENLPAGVLKDWTQDVNKTWDDFITLVADCRDMPEAEVRDTQARIYRSDEALALGLIDAVKSTAEAVPAFVAELADDTPDDDEDGDDDMDKTKGSEATSAVDYDRIGGMIGTAVTSGIGAMMAAQGRATAIRDHGKSKGQVALASKLVANDKITEAEAIEMIDAAAVTAKPAPGKVTGKGGKPAQAAEPGDDDDDDGEGDGEDAGEGDGEDDGEGEDEAEQARSARRGSRVGGGRRRDNVNHLDGAMRRSGGGSGVGAGSGEGGEKLTGDALATATLLGDHQAHTGASWGKKKAAA